jgi:hypothetical protein
VRTHTDRGAQPAVIARTVLPDESRRDDFYAGESARSTGPLRIHHNGGNASMASHLVQELLLIHKVVTRGLTVAHDHGVEFANDGFADGTLRHGYLDFVRSLLTTIHVHHDSEELIAFPSLRPVLASAPYDLLEQQHHELVRLLDAARTSLPSSDNDGDGDGTAWLAPLVSAIAAVRARWITHIAIEEQHFTAAALDAVLDAATQEDLLAKIGAHTQQHNVPAELGVPFALFNLEQSDRQIFATQFPAVVLEQLVPVLWKDAWAPMKPFLLE